VSRDSGLPLSDGLVDLIGHAVFSELGLSATTIESGTGLERNKSLEAIADEAEALGSGAVPALRSIVLTSAPFQLARPNYSHLAIAFLLWEGLVSVFSANWDECVEKAATTVGFALQTTVTDADRAHRFREALFHKVHGCASVASSLLLTTSQISSAPAWAASEVQSALSGKTVIFLGLGTVGQYVQTRLRHVLSSVPPSSANYLLVSPGNPSAAFASLLADGANHNHHDAYASRFLDDLLRALWSRVLSAVTGRAETMVRSATWANDGILRGVENLKTALRASDALSVLVWMRRACGGVLPGRPAAMHVDGETLLLGLAATANSRSLSVRGSLGAFTMELEGRYVELALWPGKSAHMLVDQEVARIDGRAAEGHYDDAEKPVLHLCLGQDGPLPSRGVPGDLVDEGPEDSLLEPRMNHEWLSVRGILDGGRTPSLA